MSGVTFPIPVGLFLRRLFNVVSSLTISNQYFLLQKAELDRERERDKGGSDARALQNGRLRDGVEQLLLYTRKKQPTASETSSSEQLLDRMSLESDSGQRKVRESSMARVQERELVPMAATAPPNVEPPEPKEKNNDAHSTIQQLMHNPTLFDPVRVPRNPIVLCHGLYGYDVLGPSNWPMLQVHYWLNTLSILKKKLGAEVIVTAVPGTGSIESRATTMDNYLREKARGRLINFVGHSMGGLDCRQLITHVKPKDYTPLSLTTLCTPHRGSPFMDWCKENIGIGKLQQKAREAGKDASDPSIPKNTPLSSSLTNLPSSLMTLLLSAFDSPAYANLTTHFLNDIFNPRTPDDPNVKYYSVAARTSHMSVFHPLWLPKMVVDGVEAAEREKHPNAESELWGNDGLVSVRSARWGEFLGTLEGCDHWDARGSSGVGGDVDWTINLNRLYGSLGEPLSAINSKISWKDMGKLVGAWRREEEEKEKKTTDIKANPQYTETDKLKQQVEDDAVLKSSTEKVSAVFDWIAEQVPAPSSGTKTVSSTAPSKVARDRDANRIKDKKSKEGEEKDLKFDLERFYVALTRKLYEEGF